VFAEVSSLPPEERDGEPRCETAWQAACARR